MAQSRLLQVLRTWRLEQARREGVEPFRVLSNTALEMLAHTLPQSPADLLLIKGIKEVKCRRYGRDLLALIAPYRGPASAGHGPSCDDEISKGDDVHGGAAPLSMSVRSEERAPNDALTVGQYLDRLNVELSGMAARVRGEVTSIEERPRVVYFSLKDKDDGSVLNCLVFRYQYEVSGVLLAVGDEVIVEGMPEIYKPFGKFNLRVGVIEFAGEGALKKSYDELLRKLEREGLFAAARKRPLPPYPERIALITSESGAAIDDFKMNLGLCGFHVTLCSVRVEGKRAVFEIIRALEYFNRAAERYDILVMIRGGGSLESLQAFNNETLVRAVAASRIPTLLGIGHEKDVSLSALAADQMVSTPTAAARAVREPFEKARERVRHYMHMIPEQMRSELLTVRARLLRTEHVLAGVFPALWERFGRVRERIVRRVAETHSLLQEKQKSLPQIAAILVRLWRASFAQADHTVGRCADLLQTYDPRRALALGYSLVRLKQGLVRSIAQVRTYDRLDISLRDGTIETEVRGVNPGGFRGDVTHE